MIIFSRAWGNFVFVCWGWMILCAWRFTVHSEESARAQTVRICVSDIFLEFCCFLFLGSCLMRYKNGSVDGIELLFWLGYLMRDISVQTYHAILLHLFVHWPRYLFAWIRKSKWHQSAILVIWNRNHLLLLFCFHGNWFFIGFDFHFFSSLLFCLFSTFFLIFKFILLHHMNILYYVLYWSEDWSVGRSVERFCLCFVWMCIVTNFNMFVLLDACILDWMQLLWATVRKREKDDQQQLSF